MPAQEEVAPSQGVAQLMLAFEIQEKSDNLLPSPKTWMASRNMLLVGSLDRGREIQQVIQVKVSQLLEKDCEHHSSFDVQIQKTKLGTEIAHKIALQLQETKYVQKHSILLIAQSNPLIDCKE